MEELQSFNNLEFGAVRATIIDNEPWFVGKDVTLALGYSNARDAIGKHVDNEDKGVAKRDTLGGAQDLTVINESGLYSLILSSKMPNAKKFKHWVTSEVLPTIRKTGNYQQIPQGKDLLALAVIEAQKMIEQQTVEIERMKPKEIFADAVSTSETSILIGDLAKLICQNGHQIGQKRLFDWMRQNGYLIKSGSSRNMPTQRSMEQKLFEVKESSIANPDGSVRVTRTTKVTGKGQIYFINRFAAAT